MLWVQVFGCSGCKSLLAFGARIWLIWRKSLVVLSTKEPCCSGYKESGCSVCTSLVFLGARPIGCTGCKTNWLLWVIEPGCSGCN